MHDHRAAKGSIDQTDTLLRRQHRRAVLRIRRLCERVLAAEHCRLEILAGNGGGQRIEDVALSEFKEFRIDRARCECWRSTR